MFSLSMRLCIYKCGYSSAWLMCVCIYLIIIKKSNDARPIEAVATRSASHSQLRRLSLILKWNFINLLVIDGHTPFPQKIMGRIFFEVFLCINLGKNFPSPLRNKRAHLCCWSCLFLNCDTQSWLVERKKRQERTVLSCFLGRYFKQAIAVYTAVG